jgi:hypothetical protein
MEKSCGWPMLLWESLVSRNAKDLCSTDCMLTDVQMMTIFYEQVGMCDETRNILINQKVHTPSLNWKFLPSLSALDARKKVLAFNLCGIRYQIMYEFCWKFVKSCQVETPILCSHSQFTMQL